MIYSLVPRLTPAFCHLQYGKSQAGVSLGTRLHDLYVLFILSQSSDTAINLDHEEWILDPEKTLAESNIRKSCFY